MRFDNGKLHRYSIGQMREKFGVDHMSSGMEVMHARRGRGTVFADSVASLSALKRVGSGLRDMFHASRSVKELEGLAKEAVGLAAKKGYALCFF